MIKLQREGGDVWLDVDLWKHVRVLKRESRLVAWGGRPFDRQYGSDADRAKYEREMHPMRVVRFNREATTMMARMTLTAVQFERAMNRMAEQFARVNVAMNSGYRTAEAQQALRRLAASGATTAEVQATLARYRTPPCAP